MRSRAGPVTEISVTVMKFSHMNTPAWDETFYSATTPTKTTWQNFLQI